MKGREIQMKCMACNFENKDGAVFCANCGNKLIEAPAPAPAQPAEGENVDASEASTTVLTADMLGHAPEPAKEKAPEPPKGFMPGPTSAPQAGPGPQPGFMPGPMNGPAPQGGPGPQPGFMPGPMPGASPVNNQNNTSGPLTMPMNGESGPLPVGLNEPLKGPALQGAPGPQQGPAQKNQVVRKRPAPEKEKKGSKEKKGNGVLVWAIVVSVLLAGCIGVGIFGYLHYTKALDEEKSIKEDLKTNLEITKSELENVNLEYSELSSDYLNAQSELEDMEEELSEAKSKNAELEAQLEEVAETSGEYEKYDDLISFVDMNAGVSSTKLFANTSVVKLEGDMTIAVYYGGENEIQVISSDEEIVEAELDEASEENPKVRTISLKKKGTGSAAVMIAENVEDGDTAAVFILAE